MADGFKTRRELVERALGALGVLGAGQSPSAEDVQAVDGFVSPLLGALSAREVLDGINPDSIPDEIWVPLGLLLAESAAPDFGVAVGNPEDPASLAFKAARAEHDIRIMVRDRPNYKAVTAEFF